MTFLDGTFLTFWRISRYFLHCIVFTVFFLVFDIFDFLDLLNCVFIISDSIIVLRFLQFIKVLKYISGSNSSKSRQKSRRKFTYHLFLEYLQRLHPHPRQKLLLRTYPTLILSINTVFKHYKCLSNINNVSNKPWKELEMRSIVTFVLLLYHWAYLVDMYLSY